MSIPTPKYAIGQTVYLASTFQTKKQHPCPDCKGQRTWIAVSRAGDEFEFGCPRCGGGYRSDDVLSLDYITHVRSTRPLTIGSVRINTDDEHQVTYMCKETGVGSGNIWDEGQLYPTQLQAEEAADALADESNKTNEYVVQKFNRTLALSDYQLSSAIKKAAELDRSRFNVDVQMLFEELRSAETNAEVLATIERWRDDRKAA